MSSAQNPPNLPPYGMPDGSLPAAPPPPQKRSWFARHKVLTGILGLVVLGAAFGATSGNADTSSNASAPSVSGGGAGSPASSPGSTAGGPAASASTSPAAPAETTPAETTPAAPPAETTPGIGSVVKVGDFSVTVTKIETGVKSVGSSGFGEKPQGQFVKVYVTVENTGNKAEYFLDSEQKLIDDKDREHSTSNASIYLKDDGFLLTEINPGNKAQGVLLYDIPKDAKPVRMALRSGMFSLDTVEVRLAK